jgi:hypothetical protein
LTSVIKWVGVHTGGPHYLDHLGVLCEGLAIPLYVTELETFKAAKEFYPGLHVEYIDLAELSLDFLAKRADVIFESGHTFAIELIPFWEMLHEKKMRVVYCPHGNSDKRSPQLRKDISLIYGDHMKNHLTQTGEISMLEKMIATGNYRIAYYRAHQKWYDQKLEALLKNRINPDKKTIFYAPTWESDSLSWYRAIEETASRFNLLLRLHPFLEELYPVEHEKIKYLCDRTPGVIDLSKFPSIYPIINRSDYYLGDFSSIGYDFLTMNKPLFFLNRHDGEIYECGVTLEEGQPIGEAIEAFQDNGGLSERRKKLAWKVFGPEKNCEIIRSEIKEALSFDRASWITEPIA